MLLDIEIVDLPPMMNVITIVTVHIAH